MSWRVQWKLGGRLKRGATGRASHWSGGKLGAESGVSDGGAEAMLARLLLDPDTRWVYFEVED